MTRAHLPAATHSPSGFTLIELLLAIAISSVVVALAGLGMVFVSQRNRASALATNRRVELNRASEFLAREIRSASQTQANTYAKDLNSRNTWLILNYPDGEQIAYYYESVEASEIWTGPGAIKRCVLEQNGTCNPRKSRVLVDGIADDISDVDIQHCSDKDGHIQQENTGFIVCINSDLRTAGLSIYGQLPNGEGLLSNRNKYLIVSTKFVARNAPAPGGCLVPNLINLTKNQAKQLWESHGFHSHHFNASLSSSKRITQQKTAPNTAIAGSIGDCSETQVFVANEDDLCDVPDYTGENIAAALADWESSDFKQDDTQSNFLAEGFDLAEDLSKEDQKIIDAQVLTPSPIDGKAFCNSTITVREQTCTVPSDLLGKSDSTVKSALTAAGFASVKTNLQNTFLVGRLSPTEETELYCSQPVLLEPEQCSIPDFLGVNSDNAQTVWAAAGYSSGSLLYNGAANKTITWQSLVPGTKIDCDIGEIELKEEKQCRLNTDFYHAEHDLGSVKDAWYGAGFYPSTINASAMANTAPAARVFIKQLQNPTTGERIEPHHALKGGGLELDCGTILKLGDQTAACSVPQLASNNTINNHIALTDAKAKWQANGFDVNKLFDEKFLDQFDIVTAQSIQAGVDVLCDTAMTISGSGCVIPDLVGKAAAEIEDIWFRAGFSKSLRSSLSGDGLRVRSLRSSSWDDYQIFSQAQTRGDVLSCSGTTNIVYNDAPTMTSISAETVTTGRDQNQITLLTTQLEWEPQGNGGQSPAQYSVYFCEVNMSQSSSITCDPKIEPASLVSEGSASVFTGMTATHSYNPSSTKNLRLCYAVVAKNASASAITPPSEVSRSNHAKTCVDL